MVLELFLGFVLGIIFTLILFKLSKEKARHFFNVKKSLIRRNKYCWGQEDTWANNIFYIGQIYHLRANSAYPKQYHKEKLVNLFVLSGQIKIFLEKNGKVHEMKLQTGEIYCIYPETIYEIIAINNARILSIANQCSHDNYQIKKSKK